MSKAVIWDFNGTLLDDLAISLATINELLAENSLRRLPDAAAYRKVFGFPVRAYYTRLGFDFEKQPFDRLAERYMELWHQKEHTAGLTEGALDTLSAFRAAGVRQFLLSATEEQALKAHAASLGIAEFFEGIYGAADCYGEGKKSAALALKSVLGETDNVSYIGDTPHDVEIAALFGGKMYYFKGGHQLPPQNLPETIRQAQTLTEIKEAILCS